MSLKQVYKLLYEHIPVNTDDELWINFDKFYDYNSKKNNESFKKANYIVWLHLEKFVEENDFLLKENKKLQQENDKINYGHKFLINILQENKIDYENNLIRFSNEKINLEKELYHLNMKEIEYKEKIKVLEDKINETVVVRKNKRVVKTDIQYVKMTKRQKVD